MKKGFTLAEVLITLGIIGVVAALTIPIVMVSHRKKTVEVKLEKFYSTINQAVKISQVKNGDMDGWIDNTKTYSYDDTLEWMNTYILPYLKYDKIQSINDKGANGTNSTYVGVYLTNGELMLFKLGNTIEIIYYTSGDSIERPSSRRNRFIFQYNKINGDTTAKNIEPFAKDWNGNYESLKQGQYGCTKENETPNYCAKMIQYNNWKIDDDYPW